MRFSSILSRSSNKKDEFESELLDIARVTRVTAGGKHLSFRVVAVTGDRKGRVGVGVEKGLDVAQAIEKATRQAKKNLIAVPMQHGTIPHEVEGRFGASKVLFKPQRQGKGLVAGGVARSICAYAGIQNISGKFLSATHNKLNNAFAVIDAFKKLKVKSFSNRQTPALPTNKPTTPEAQSSIPNP